MKTIYKYPLEGYVERQIIEMPEGAEILTVQVQDGTPCIWALVTPLNKIVEKTVYMIGTGHKISTDKGDYVATVQAYDGSLILHVFIK